MKKYHTVFFWVCVFVGIFDIFMAMLCNSVNLKLYQDIFVLSSVLMVFGAFFYWFSSRP
jgi:hypothetical protein